jgi:hypothetical protein
MNTPWLDSSRHAGAQPATPDGGEPWDCLKAGSRSAPTGVDPGYKAYRAGTHRTVAPAETLGRVC